MTNVPSEKAKTWTIAKTLAEDETVSNLRIICNEIVVLNWDFPKSPPDKDECKRFNLVAFKTWFLKEKSWDTGNMMFLTYGLNYTIATSEGLTKSGEEVTTSCQVILAPNADKGAVFDTVGENPRWIMLPAGKLIVTPTDTSNDTIAAFDKETKKFNLTLKKAPPFDTTWKCEFNLSNSNKEDGPKTVISAQTSIKILTMTMSVPWILKDTDLIVVCVVGHGSASLTDVSVTWGSTAYTSASATAAGLIMKITADTLKDTQTITLTIPKAKVSATMEQAFKCSAKVSGSFVVEASGTAGVLAYIKQPAKTSVVESSRYHYVKS